MNKNGVGRRCDYCRSDVRLTIAPPRRSRGPGSAGVRRGRPLGVRCGQCLVVFCLDCAWRHFGVRVPRWARQRRGLRVRGVASRREAMRRRVVGLGGVKRFAARFVANEICFYNACNAKR